MTIVIRHSSKVSKVVFYTSHVCKAKNTTIQYASGSPGGMCFVRHRVVVDAKRSRKNNVLSSSACVVYAGLQCSQNTSHNGAKMCIIIIVTVVRDEIFRIFLFFFFFSLHRLRSLQKFRSRSHRNGSEQCARVRRSGRPGRSLPRDHLSRAPLICYGFFFFLSRPRQTFFSFSF